MSGLNEQIAWAKREIRKLKRTYPGLLPEWARMHCAEQALRKALFDYEQAVAAWERLGR